MCVFECWLLCFVYVSEFFHLFVFCRDYDDRVAYITMPSSQLQFGSRACFFIHESNLLVFDLCLAIIFKCIVSERSAVSLVSACHRVAAPVLLGKIGAPRLKNQSIQESNACVFSCD